MSYTDNLQGALLTLGGSPVVTTTEANNVRDGDNATYVARGGGGGSGTSGTILFTFPSSVNLTAIPLTYRLFSQGGSCSVTAQVKYSNGTFATVHQYSQNTSGDTGVVTAAGSGSWSDVIGVYLTLGGGGLSSSSAQIFDCKAQSVNLPASGAGYVACVGDESDHGGYISTSNQDGTVSAGGDVIAVNGAMHVCPITGHGTTAITAITTKSYINGKLILTYQAVAGCGAKIYPPDRKVYVEA